MRNVGCNGQELRRVRSLERQHGCLVALVFEHHGGVGATVHPLKITLDMGSVDHDEVQAWFHPVNNQVVDHATAIVAHQCVLRLSQGHLADVIGEQMIQDPLSVRSRRQDLAHVADVEQPDFFADGGMFFQDAAVDHRHFPSAKRHHLRAQGNVGGIQRRAFELFSDLHDSRALR